jgi:hypothetical protein
MKKKQVFLRFFLAMLAASAFLSAAEHLVRPGDNSFDQVRASLKEGDRVVFEPGQYYGGLHTEYGNITLRAAIPGSVVLRADVDAGAFEPHSPRVWRCAWPELPQAVNERDTFTVYRRVSTLNELSLIPGAWCYQDGQLYVQSSDADDPARHYLTISTYDNHGLLFNSALNSNQPIRNVVIEGLILTGFNNNSLKLEDRHSRRFSYWPLLIFGAKNCAVRQTTAFLNGEGMAFNGGVVGYGGEVEDSVMEDCRAFGNRSAFNVSGGGLAIYGPARNSAIRGAFTADNSPRGIGFYGGLFTNCLMQDCLSLDGQRSKNTCGEGSILRRNITTVMDPYSTPLKNCLVFSYLAREERQLELDRESNILLRYEEKADLKQEFADPENHDFRPLPNSRFLGRGPQPQPGAVFLASSPAQLKELLRDDVTIYLLPGEWGGELELRNLRGLRLAGRGKGFLATDLQVKIDNCQNLSIERLSVAKWEITDGKDIRIKQCFGELSASQSDSLRLTHGYHQRALISACPRAFVSACVFGGKEQDSGWADYNAYSQTVPANEPHSFLAIPEMGPELSFVNGWQLQGRAIDGFPVGPFRRQLRNTTLKVDGPKVVARTSSTANIELVANLEVQGKLKYGDTPECKSEISFSQQTYHNIGLSGLKPGSELFFKVELHGKVGEQFSNQTLANNSSERSFSSDLQKISLPLKNRPPQTYHVSTQGDDAADGISKPWRSVSQAAKMALAGDTVIIAGGVYQESVLIRSTGDAGAEITFRGKTGEKALLCGDKRRIVDGIVVSNQGHLLFDNLHFQGFCLTGARIDNAANISFRRCLWDARRLSFTRALQASCTASLALDNCVRVGGHEGLEIRDCPDFSLRNSVMFYGGVTSLRLFNPGMKASICNNLFTDNLLMKGSNPLLFVHDIDQLQEENNCFFLRMPPDQKPLIGYNILNGKEMPAMGSSQYLGTQRRVYGDYLAATARETGAIFANPQMRFMPDFIAKYQTLEEWRENWQKYSGRELPPSDEEITFADFFAQNPELLKRSIGLQAEKFDLP